MEEMLRTLLLQVAGLLNSRPLTYTSSDPEDLRSLIPNDLLNRPPISERAASTTQTDTTVPMERFKYVQKLSNLFWDLWIKRYLPSLISRSKWRQKQRLHSRGFGAHCRTKRSKRIVAHGDSVRSASQQRPDGSSSTSRTKDGVYTKPIHRLSPVCLLESVDNEQDLIGDQPINGMVGTGGVF